MQGWVVFFFFHIRWIFWRGVSFGCQFFLVPSLESTRKLLILLLRNKKERGGDL